MRKVILRLRNEVNVPVVLPVVLLAALLAGIAQGQVLAEPGLSPNSNGATVNFSLVPASPTVNENTTFTLDITVDSGSQDISGAQAYLDFDQTRLQVMDIDNGPTFPIILANSADNAQGQIAYSAGKICGAEGQPACPSGTILLATITFQAIGPTAGTDVTFSTTSPQDTRANFLDTSFTPGTFDATVVVNNVVEPCSIPGSGDLEVTTSCDIQGDVVVPANVIVSDNMTLIITSGSSLNIDFSNYHLRIGTGARVIIEDTGKIY